MHAQCMAVCLALTFLLSAGAARHHPLAPKLSAEEHGYYWVQSFDDLLRFDYYVNEFKAVKNHSKIELGPTFGPLEGAAA